MPKSRSSKKEATSVGAEFRTFSAAKQVSFHQLLAEARKTWLTDGLSETLKTVDPVTLRNELLEFVPKDVQKTLSSSGVRDEWVFRLLPC